MILRPDRLNHPKPVEEPPTKKMKLSPFKALVLPLFFLITTRVWGRCGGSGWKSRRGFLIKLLEEPSTRTVSCCPSARVTVTPLLGTMTAGERRMVNEKATGLLVRVVDGSGHRFEMVLKYLDCNRSYWLIGQFSKFVAKNRVRAGHVIQMWGFRGGDGLELALLITTPTRTPLSSTPTPTFDEREAADALLLLKSSA